MTLVEGESFDIRVGSGSGEGLEVWRRLHKRWDPLTTGRARGLLRESLCPGRANLRELQGAVERVEDLMKRYTQRRAARSDQRHTSPEDIRSAALEALLPEELERHCQLQRSRSDAYQKLREEVVLYAEARGYAAQKRGQVAKAREDREYRVDVGGFGQWKKLGGFGQWKKRPTFKGKEKNRTGKGKGARKDGAKSSGQANAQKIQGQCWNCGKTSHQSKDCWARPQKQQSQGQANYPGKGNDEKGKSGKVEERKANPKMLEHLLGISKLEVQLRGRWRRLHRRRRQAQWLVRLTRLNAQRWICVQPRWQSRSFNVDTGAGGTVWPMNADCACEKVWGPAGRNYKTATGEVVEGQGTFPSSMSECLGTPTAHDWRRDVSSQTVVECWGRDKGHALWLDGNVGYLIQKESPILTAMRMCFEKACEQHSWNGAIDLTKERGTSRWQAAKATWNERMMSVPMKWMLESREVVVYRGAFGR